MTSGTLCFTTIPRSWSSRALDLCTIRLMANGAAGRSGWRASCAASRSLISITHSSNCSAGRALSAGMAPMMPDVHWATTRSGTEMMKSGAPIAGSERRPLSLFSSGMCVVPLCFGFS